ncbi:MAG TPA: PIG-L family deacetylase [Acidimicrobiia bacterium]|nr:PIG-L family deacetylase [Acidimicrobiia bacterium]
MGYTLVTFHAHPDDESIATAGTMARAKAEGHRVVLVLATRGELGEFSPDALAPGETLTERRVAEVAASAEVLGVDRVEFLGYRDSGMAGEATNDDEGAFARADIEEAAARLADVLREEDADVLTVYDNHGGYGHPDHVQVHRVGVRAAELAGTRRVYESTMNRDYIQGLMARRAEEMPDSPDAPSAAEMEDFGSPAEIITTTVDVRDFVDRKRSAMAAHASQIAPDSFFLAMPLDAFREAFGAEWFIRRDAPDAAETWLFDDL